MENDSILKEIGAKNGLEIALDENRACTLELADGRVMLLQERADLDELDFVATLGPVPEEVRAAVFTELLSANFYWKETLGATLSWNADLEEVVLIFPLPLADATPKSVEAVFGRFVELQAAWAERFAGMVAAAQDRGDDDEDGGDGDEDGGDGEPGENDADGDAAKDDLIINP